MDGNENETQDATAGSAPAPQTGRDAPSATAPQNNAGPPATKTADGGTNGAETTTPPAKPRRRKRHTQPEVDLNLLNDFELLVEGMESAAEDFAALLPAYGLTPEVVARYRAELTAARAAVFARREALAAKSSAASEQHTRFVAMVRTMGIFRQLARAVLDEAGRIALALDEPLPTALGTFLIVARQSLEAAQEEPYAALLATTTFGPGRVVAALVELDELQVAYQRRRQIDLEAKTATGARDEAVSVVRRSIRALRVELSALHRTYPDVVMVSVR